MQPRLQSDFERKVQQARQAGFSDDQINSYLALRQSTRPQRPTQTMTQRPQTQGGGFQPSALISEASGLGGALGGAKIGAGIGALGGPVGAAIGGVVGAGLGGFLGGGLGSAAEQQVRDKRVDTGKAVREGAIEGLFAAGPLKLLKGGKALARGARVGPRGASLVEDLSQALTTGVTTQAGRATTGAARGITTGARLSGDKILPKVAQEINEFLTKTVKARPVSAAGQLDDLAKYQNKLFSQLDSKVTKFNKTLGKNDQIFIANKLGNAFQKNLAGATSAQRELAAQLAREASSKGSLKDLNDYIKLLDNQINHDRAGDAVSTQREQVFRLFRTELRDAITDPDVIPGLKAIKNNLSKSFQAEELLLNAAGRTGSALYQYGARVPNRAIQGLQARLGRTLETAGGALDSRNVLSQALRVGAGSQVAAGLNQQGQVAQLQQTEPIIAGDLTQQDTFSQLTGALGGQQVQPEMVQQAPVLTQDIINQAILLDLQETGGANVEQIQMIAQMYGPQAAPEVTEEEAKVQSLTNSVGLLLNNYQAAGGGQGAGGILPSLIGRTPGLRSTGIAEQAQVFEDQRKALIAPLARAISGEIGVLTDRDIARAEGLLPRLSDTPQVAQQKINDLLTLIQQSGGGAVNQSVVNQQIQAGVTR